MRNHESRTRRRRTGMVLAMLVSLLTWGTSGCTDEAPTGENTFQVERETLYRAADLMIIRFRITASRVMAVAIRLPGGSEDRQRAVIDDRIGTPSVDAVVAMHRRDGIVEAYWRLKAGGSQLHGGTGPRTAAAGPGDAANDAADDIVLEAGVHALGDELELLSLAGEACRLVVN